MPDISYVIVLLQMGLSLLVVGLFVILGQFFWAKKVLQGEYSRKFTHMLSSVWVAMWGMLFEPWQIVVMAVALAMGVYLTRRAKLFNSIYSVKRLTYGELSYALVIGLCGAFFHDPAVFALCIINLGFADGLAAIIGKKFGKVKYEVWGEVKTFIGASACFLFAVLSGAFFWQLSGAVDAAGYWQAGLHILASSLAIACAELIGYRGFDNISIPLITGFAFMRIL